MRTTVDIDAALLGRAKRLALKEKQTLGAVVGQALAAYLGTRRQAAGDPPFELLVAGNGRGRFPSPAEMAALEEEEELRVLAIPPRK